MYNIYHKYIVNDSPPFSSTTPSPSIPSLSFPLSIPSPPLSIPPPFHLPTPTANIQKPPMLLCYCVTASVRFHLPHVPPSFLPPFPLSPTPFPLTSFHILSLVRSFPLKCIYVLTRPPLPPLRLISRHLEPETQKTRLLASGITLIFIVPNSIQLGMRQEVTRYRCWRGAAVGSSESDNTPPTRTFQRKIRRLEK